MLTPAIRAIALTLPLLVSGVLADDEDPSVAADDLALLAHRLDRRSYLHGPFRLMIQTGWLWRPERLPLPVPRTKVVHTEPSRTQARPSRIAKGPGRAAERRRANFRVSRPRRTTRARRRRSPRWA